MTDSSCKHQQSQQQQQPQQYGYTRRHQKEQHVVYYAVLGYTNALNTTAGTKEQYIHKIYSCDMYEPQQQTSSVSRHIVSYDVHTYHRPCVCCCSCEKVAGRVVDLIARRDRNGSKVLVRNAEGIRVPHVVTCDTGTDVFIAVVLLRGTIVNRTKYCW